MDYKVHGVTKSWTPLSDFHFLFTKVYISIILSLHPSSYTQALYICVTLTSHV